MEKIIRTLEEMKSKAGERFIATELLMRNNTSEVGINSKAYLTDIEEINNAINILKNNKYTKEDVDKMLTKQREICCDAMEDWCEKNNIKKSGHIVLYAPRP